ncbi:hypothetical protein [Nostoc sp.]|uniref:hypothetical protein n=1 Tax=Nostoc sp. TaxID=1180 RepID=UPI002FFCFAB4
MWAIAYENGKSNINIFKLCYRLRSYNSITIDFVQGQDKVDVRNLNISDWTTLQKLISNDGENNALIKTYFDGYSSSDRNKIKSGLFFRNCQLWRTYT